MSDGLFTWFGHRFGRGNLDERSCIDALVSLSEEVPEANSTNRLGIDRGQNQLATAVPKHGFGLLFSGKEVKHRRRRFQIR